MSVQVTLSLPDRFVENAKKFGVATHQRVETVLADALEMALPMTDDLPGFFLQPPISTLSDEEVLRLADSKMDEAQNRRLGDLQAKGKASGLSQDERYELSALLRICQLGQLRKSEALAEVVQRGLREPLAA
ncbi:MAG: hypothetical protein AAB401_24470 [Acidobacteriota bacterium]